MAFERFPTFTGSGTYGTGVGSSASTNVKGAWTQIAASTSADCGSWWIQIGYLTGVTRQLTDIGLGAGGAEVLAVVNILTQAGNDASGSADTRIPVKSDIPSGTRIAARTQSTTASSALLIALLLDESVALAGPTRIATYGVTMATSVGSVVDPGGTADTKGAYTQIAASLAATDWLVLLLGFRAITTTNFCQWAVDLATGAAGGESVLVPNLVFESIDLGGDAILPTSVPLSVVLDNSTRVAARAACTTTAGNRTFEVSLLGAAPLAGTEGVYPANAIGLNYITYPTSSSTADGATVTAGGTGSTKGSYTQLTASSAFASVRALITTVRTNTGAAGGLDYLFDVATGAGGSETVVVANLLAEATNTSTSNPPVGVVDVPLAIAISTRIAMRSQCSTNSVNMFGAITLIAAGSITGIASFTTDGPNTSTSKGAVVDAGGTANTKGSYTQLSASLAAVANYVALSLTSNGKNTRTNQDTIWAMDLATGAGGAEAVLFPDMRAGCGDNSGRCLSFQPKGISFPTYIAASTRVAMRASCSNNTAGDRTLGCAFIYGTDTSGLVYPQSTTGLNYITYPVGPTADATQLTGGTGNVKGSYVQFVASTSFASNRAHLTTVRTGTVSGGVSLMFDVATGAGGAEVVVVSNVLGECLNAFTSGSGAGFLDLPLSIVVNTRVAARVASGSAGFSMFLSIGLMAAGTQRGIQTFTTVGADTSTTHGVSVDPGGTLNTKGSYVQLSASLADIAQFMAVSMDSKANGSRTNSTQWAFDVATGAGGAEVVLVPDLRMTCGAGANADYTHTPKGLSFFTYIDILTRVAARASSNVTASPDRVFEMVLLYAPAPLPAALTGMPSVSQVAPELLSQPLTSAWVSQVAPEVLTLTTADGRVSQTATEILSGVLLSSDLRVSQTAFEVLSSFVTVTTGRRPLVNATLAEFGLLNGGLAR